MTWWHDIETRARADRPPHLPPVSRPVLVLVIAIVYWRALCEVRFDDEARTWSRADRYGYFGVKWFFIIMGFWIMSGMAIEEYQAGSPGLGLGFITTFIILMFGGLCIGLVAAAHRDAA